MKNLSKPTFVEFLLFKIVRLYLSGCFTHNMSIPSSVRTWHFGLVRNGISVLGFGNGYT